MSVNAKNAEVGNDCQAQVLAAVAFKYALLLASLRVGFGSALYCFEPSLYSILSVIFKLFEVSFEVIWAFPLMVKSWVPATDVFPTWRIVDGVA